MCRPPSQQATGKSEGAKRRYGRAGLSRWRALSADSGLGSHFTTFGGSLMNNSPFVAISASCVRIPSIWAAEKRCRRTAWAGGDRENGRSDWSEACGSCRGARRTAKRALPLMNRIFNGGDGGEIRMAVWIWLVSFFHRINSWPIATKRLLVSQKKKKREAERLNPKDLLLDG